MERRRTAGFSLMEVMICVAIAGIITVAALPNMMTAIANMRLRSSMTSLAGVLQNCRVLAVKQNRHMSTHFDANSYGILAFVKPSVETGGVETGDSQVELEAPVTKVDAPSGPGAPSTISTSVLGFTPLITEPSFNPTGLPCEYDAGACANHGFIYYFHDRRPAGQVGWAALSISPAGRLKKWYWSGSAWID
jgi:prepilin-type N-terminal cleavage/methylation domain-containing protein